MPPPVPPSVKLGRITIGKPVPPISAVMRFCTAQASSIEWAMPLWPSPGRSCVIASLNFRRSSALSMASVVGADHLDAVLGQHAVLVQVQRAVQRGLPAHGRQDRVGLFLGDDLLDHLPGDRLDVGHVGRLRVGHDRRRVAVDQDDLVALLAQRLAGLRAGVVELAGLADDDRAGADDEDALDVGALGHLQLLLIHQRR